ncbi:MAG TPA: hypothetical protein VJ278_03575 [Chthoniobacterales bacterium]|jgi:hypothetical protein|nr:hypothetical protein [Chthoniobacterales bacterium]
MTMAVDPNWYLRKYEDGGIFGPLPFHQLTHWAAKARIAPRDLVSSDQQTWMKAPMVSELGMDWLVEVTSERYYGPTTLGAINEFVRLGEVTPENFVINTCDGSRRRIREIASFFPSAAEDGETLVEGSPAAAGMSIEFEERIRDLERSLGEERRALHEAEARYRELEQRYQQLLAASDAQ